MCNNASKLTWQFVLVNPLNICLLSLNTVANFVLYRNIAESGCEWFYKESSSLFFVGNDMLYRQVCDIPILFVNKHPY